PAAQERLVLVPLEAQAGFAVLGLGRPPADQPVQLVELVLAGAPLAADGDLPAVAGADVQDAVARGRRQLGPRVFHPEDAVLDGRVRRREADALNLDFELALRLVLEQLGVGLLDGGAAAQLHAAVVVVLAVFGPERGERLGVALVERLLEVFGGFADRLAGGIPALVVLGGPLPRALPPRRPRPPPPPR